MYTVIYTVGNNLDLQKFSAFIKGEVKALGNSASSFNDVVWIFRDLVVATKAVDTDDDEFDQTNSPNVLCSQLVMSRSFTDGLTELANRSIGRVRVHIGRTSGTNARVDVFR